MAILPIRHYPDPVLRVNCSAVETFDDELAKLAQDMIETMHAAPGVGLAAPQVGIERRIFVVDLSVGEDPEQIHVFVNPRIVESEGRETDVEGCLSLPGVTNKVSRPTWLKVEAQDVEGESFSFEAADWLARAICHESDHLNGVLFTDHLRGLRKEKAKRQLRKLAAEAASFDKPRHEISTERPSLQDQDPEADS
ncbi:MAG: peptide deformylase [Acidobacteriota bacterium]